GASMTNPIIGSNGWMWYSKAPRRGMPPFQITYVLFDEFGGEYLSEDFPAEAQHWMSDDWREWAEPALTKVYLWDILTHDRYPIRLQWYYAVEADVHKNHSGVTVLRRVDESALEVRL
ncbi:MAG: hypothetical protein ACNA8H_06110, partial [Anaerolineales bacterium]